MIPPGTWATSSPQLDLKENLPWTFIPGSAANPENVSTPSMRELPTYTLLSSGRLNREGESWETSRVARPSTIISAATAPTLGPNANPIPPQATAQKNPSTSNAKPSIGRPSTENVRRPVHPGLRSAGFTLDHDGTARIGDDVEICRALHQHGPREARCIQREGLALRDHERQADATHRGDSSGLGPCRIYDDLGPDDLGPGLDPDDPTSVAQDLRHKRAFPHVHTPAFGGLPVELGDTVRICFGVIGAMDGTHQTGQLDVRRHPRNAIQREDLESDPPCPEPGGRNQALLEQRLIRIQ